jgi:predicted kinase
MAKMYLMCGCSGAGKTTFSKEFAKKNNLLRLGIDEFYEMVNGDECLHTNTFEVWISFFLAIHEAEINNIDCVIDTNALTWHQRMQMVEWFPTFERYLIYIDADEELRKTNNMARRRQVPDDAMDKMAKQLQIPSPELDTEWDHIIHIKNVDNSFTDVIVLKGENILEII